MFINAKKANEFANNNKSNIHNITIEDSILYAAMKGATSLLWEGHIPDSILADLKSNGYKIIEKEFKGQICYLIEWKIVEE